MPSARYKAAAWLAVVMCFCLIVLGAFVRLSHAGLSCPDWPTCYGALTWPEHADEVALANANFPERLVEHEKTWREQVHRHLAALLGLLVLGLNIALSPKQLSPLLRLLTPVALVAAAIAAYVGKLWWLSGIFALVGEIGLLSLALRSTGRVRLMVLALAVINFQALLGMWTVTLSLKPVVVSAHLLGGLTTFALLLWHALGTADLRMPKARPLAGAALGAGLALLTMQIALGGWVSSNYAALACPDFPTCQGEWWPDADFKEGFVLWRGVGVDYEGGVLDGSARAAIHLSHRIGAVVVSAYLLWLAALAFSRGWRISGTALLLALTAQVALGIANVVLALPLAVATAHNAVAALLLATLLVLIFQHRARLTALAPAPLPGYTLAA